MQFAPKRGIAHKNPPEMHRAGVGIGVAKSAVEVCALPDIKVGTAPTRCTFANPVNCLPENMP
jgi:hypothetical protein